ncbi:hypothetical protein L596_009429 [Steinernema carpocapsae]|uniref:Uncharacterized protein n=1 Tax=Steinernema carpocapsae TaxID=34508 RepID=A0A4U5PFB7_STECR|nr:hypothetical protein L596_009429 [Steinernema carpocapsae]
MSPSWLRWLAIFASSVVTGGFDGGGVNRKLTVEKPLDFKIELCSHERHPMQSDTMLFFPEAVKFCASITTSKRHSHLEVDRRYTTYLQPVVTVTWKALDAYDKCKMEFIGYGGEYRLSPDLGYYTSCQRSISQYINHLVGHTTPTWNITNPRCPIQGLPLSYKDYLACDFIENKWYQLEFKSAIKYENYYNKLYHSHWSNYSTSYVFKPERALSRNGTEIDWLHRMITFKVKTSNCSQIRYLVYLDKDWPIPMTIYIDYYVRGKFSKHLANGTIDEWHNGRFYMIPLDWDHDLCIRLTWTGAKRQTTICRKIARKGECDFSKDSTRKSRFCWTVYLLCALCWLLCRPVDKLEG